MAGKLSIQVPVLQIAPWSDGESQLWPKPPVYRPSSDEGYLSNLGPVFAQYRDPAASGACRINRLPHGYACFETDQHNGVQVYKRLFGHPSGRFYDSTKKFQPHFLWLMSGMSGDCPCVMCAKKKPHKPDQPTQPAVVVRRRTREVEPVSNTSTRSNSATRTSTSRPQRNVPRPGSVYAGDEEGTEDVFKDCIKYLQNAKTSKKGIELDIDEKRSMDWRAEHDDAQALPNHLTQLEHQHSFIPRLGELVLWCPDFLDDHYLMVDTETEEYGFYSFKHKRFHGVPAWRGGVVAAAPSTSHQDAVDFQDILDLPLKTANLNTSGFRIETLPDPNNDLDKSDSKQYRYVPLRNIRPLSHWGVLLQGISVDKWHPSIQAALTCFTAISLVERWRFNGEWPNGHIKCKAMYLGSELITVGDVVRFAEPSAEKCENVLIVDSIRLNLIQIKDEHVSPNSPYLASHTQLTVVGRAFTLDIWQHYEMPFEERANVALPNPIDVEEVKKLFRPVGASEYGSWYPLHPLHQRYEVSHDRILGRMYEADAVRLWTGQFQRRLKPGESSRARPKLDFDISSIQSGRKYATETNERLPHPTEEVMWFWADTRAQALALETINGLDVGNYHDVRDAQTLKSWNAQLKIIDGLPVNEEVLKQAEPMSKRGRPAGSKVIDGKLYLADELANMTVVDGQTTDLPRPKPKSSSQMAGAALASTDDEADEFGSEDDGFLQPVDESVMKNKWKVQDTEPKPQKRKMTKQEIMASVDEGDSVNDEDSEGDAWITEPVPLYRGGTEESEGGDYIPMK